MMHALGHDPTVVAGIAQAGAALLAVLMGWLLSVLTERRSWKRRRLEQIRDRQLAMLETLATHIQVSVNSCNILLTRASELLDLLGSAPTSSGAGVVDLLVVERRGAVNAELACLDSAVSQLIADSLILRMLSFKSAWRSTVESLVASLERLISIPRSDAFDYLDADDIRRLARSVNEYLALVPGVIDPGIRSLTG